MQRPGHTGRKALAKEKLATAFSTIMPSNDVLKKTVWPGQLTVLSRKIERSCTGPFNWGGAHCAGENVKRKTGPFPQKSLKTTKQEQNNKTTKRAQPATATRNPPARLPGARAKKQTTKRQKRLQRQIQVRLNVHRNILRKAPIR